MYASTQTIIMGTIFRAGAASYLVLAFLLLLPDEVFSRPDMDKAASIFEKSLSCGHAILSGREAASLVEAAIGHFPEIAANPRIAGTTGPVSENTINGYYGGEP